MSYYIDPAHQFSSNQAITASADSTNVLDTQATPTLKDLGIRPMVIEVVVTEAFNTLTSLQIALKSDSTTNLDTSETVHVDFGAIPLASLTLGARFQATLPFGNYERYLGLEYTVSGSNPTLGKISAHLVPSVDRTFYFPDGSSIVAG